MPQSLDLASEYSKGLAWHGCGHALYHPVAVESMEAPCVGYFDAKGKWHLIANLAGQPGDSQGKKRSEYTYLKDQPQRQPVATHMWAPKQSSDVRELSVGLSAATP